MKFKHHGEEIDSEKYEGAKPDVYMKPLGAILDPRNSMIADCFFCGKRALPTFDIGATSPMYRCCEQCIRDRGLDRLRAGADEAVQALAARDRRPKYCGHCGTAIQQPARKTIMVLWCPKCEHDRPKMKAQA